jgi:putative endonuclease
MPASFYILASRRNGTLYHGSTDDLSKRVWEHKNKLTPGFTSRYSVTKLVYYEHYDLLMDARAREYKVKRWRRAWKLQLIEAMNPTWRDLYSELNS